MRIRPGESKKEGNETRHNTRLSPFYAIRMWIHMPSRESECGSTVAPKSTRRTQTHNEPFVPVKVWVSMGFRSIFFSSFFLFPPHKSKSSRTEPERSVLRLLLRLRLRYNLIWSANRFVSLLFISHRKAFQFPFISKSKRLNMLRDKRYFFHIF